MLFSRTLVAAWWLLLPAVYSQAPPLPSFGQFHVSSVFLGKPAQPVLKSADQRRFRTRIREGAAEGPNFAGHYTLVPWGCGAGCVSLVVIDATAGDVWDGPFSVLSWDRYTYEGTHPSNTPEFEPLDFHTDSRLLIARGCPEEKNCASYFYEWTGKQFKLLRKVPGVPIPR